MDTSPVTVSLPGVALPWGPPRFPATRKPPLVPLISLGSFAGLFQLGSGEPVIASAYPLTGPNTLSDPSTLPVPDSQPSAISTRPAFRTPLTTVLRTGKGVFRLSSHSAGPVPAP